MRHVGRGDLIGFRVVHLTFPEDPPVGLREDRSGRRQGQGGRLHDHHRQGQEGLQGAPRQARAEDGHGRRRGQAEGQGVQDVRREDRLINHRQLGFAVHWSVVKNFLSKGKG